MVISTRGKEEIIQSMKEYADTRLKLDLLFFWNRYPYARFSSGVIAHALDYRRKVDVEEALQWLVEAQLVEKDTGQGVPVYFLTTDHERRQRVLVLSAPLN